MIEDPGIKVLFESKIIVHNLSYPVDFSRLSRMRLMMKYMTSVTRDKMAEPLNRFLAP